MKHLFNGLFRFLIFGVFFSVQSHFAFAQSSSSGGKLYMAMPDVGPDTKAFMASNNIKSIPVLSSADMSPTGVQTLDVQNFTNAINKHIPDAFASGYACIDWEGKIGGDLAFKPTNSPEFQNALNQYIKAITLAKQLRPNVKWGFFGIPYQPVTGMKPNVDIPSLLSLCDVFFPALYIPSNPASTEGLRTKDEKDKWISDNVSNVLDIAAKMNKPVIGFIWHRFYNPGFKGNSLHLIPLAEFDGYIQEILSISHHGKSVDAVLWWGPDTYYYSVKSQPVMDELSNSGTANFAAYHDALILKYLKDANKAANGQ